jgi:predicted phage terminase large subunit-like protein
MDTSAYRRVFKTRIPAIGDRTQKRAADFFEVVGHDGSYTSLGAKQSPAGEGFPIILLDDVLKGIAQAQSETEREAIWDSLNADVLSRLEGQGGVLLCNTRWHLDDPAGRFLEAATKGADEWEVIHFPALAEEADEYREVGESIDEDRWPRARFEQIKANFHAAGRGHFWDALYQGNPTSKVGRIFKVAQIPVLEELPAKVVRTFRGIDKGGTADGGDWTAGVAIAQLEPNDVADYAVIDVMRHQLERDERETEIRHRAQRDGRTVRVVLEQEPGSGGKDSALGTIKMLRAIGVHASGKPATGSKEARADPFAIQCNLGKVCVLRREWTDPYLDELRDFPTGKHDDQVDASALAFNALDQTPSGWGAFYAMNHDEDEAA